MNSKKEGKKVNYYSKNISIYSKRNTLIDYFEKDHIRVNFLKWMSNNDPDTIHYLYKLLKQYNNDKNKEDENIKKKFIQPRTNSKTLNTRRRKKMNKGIILM